MRGGMFRRIARPSGLTGRNPGDRVNSWGPEASTEEKTEPMGSEKPEVIESSDSLDARRDAIAKALRDKFPPKKKKGADSYPCCSPWPKEFTAEFVIFEHNGKLMACPYEMKGGEATLGKEFYVEQQYVPVEESEATTGSEAEEDPEED